MVFWVMIPCTLVGSYQCFGRSNATVFRVEECAGIVKTGEPCCGSCTSLRTGEWTAWLYWCAGTVVVRLWVVLPSHRCLLCETWGSDSSENIDCGLWHFHQHKILQSLTENTYWKQLFFSFTGQQSQPSQKRLRGQKCK